MSVFQILLLCSQGKRLSSWVWQLLGWCYVSSSDIGQVLHVVIVCFENVYGGVLRALFFQDLMSSLLCRFAFSCRGLS
jgi:hypothetical protein